MSWRKMSTVPTFSFLKSLTVSLTVSSKFSMEMVEEARQPFQFKFTVKYDSTDSEILCYGCKTELQSEVK